MQRHEGEGECWGREYHRCFRVEYKERSNKVIQQGWVLRGSGGPDQEKHWVRVEEAGRGSPKKGIRMESGKMELAVHHAFVAKTSQEQVYCSALQRIGQVPLGHPPNLPGH